MYVPSECVVVIMLFSELFFTHENSIPLPGELVHSVVIFVNLYLGECSFLALVELSFHSSRALENNIPVVSGI